MKWLSWLGRLSVTIVVVSLLTIVTTGYVVNYYIEHMLSRFHISMTDGGPSVTDIMKGLVGFQSVNQDSKSVLDSNLSGQAPSQQTQSETHKTDSQDNQDDPSLGDSEAKVPQNNEENDMGAETPPATGGTSSADANHHSNQNDEVVVTPDDLIAKKDSLDNKDKESVFTILMSKLPQEEMQKITTYLEDGLTEAEVLAIEQVLSKYLDKTEYAKVMEILKK